MPDQRAPAGSGRAVQADGVARRFSQCGRVLCAPRLPTRPRSQAQLGNGMSSKLCFGVLRCERALCGLNAAKQSFKEQLRSQAQAWERGIHGVSPYQQLIEDFRLLLRRPFQPHVVAIELHAARVLDLGWIEGN